MDNKDFNEILKARQRAIHNTLGMKEKEYAHGGDRLHNFKVAARMNGVTVSEALWGMATKHLVSVTDLVVGNLKPTPDMVNEKIGDMINYLILLEAVLWEENMESE